MKTLVCLFMLLSLFKTSFSQDSDNRLYLLQIEEEGGKILTFGAGNYSPGEEVVLRARTGLGYRFLGWDFNGTHLTPEGELHFIMPDMDVVLSAKAKEIPVYELVIDSGLEEITIQAHAGDEVYLTASFRSGFEFISWSSGDLLLSEEPSMRFIVPPMDMRLQASFSLNHPAVVFPLICLRNRDHKRGTCQRHLL